MGLGLERWVVHVYEHAELYAVVLAWLTIPTAATAAYLFLYRHADLFRADVKTGNDGKDR